MLSQPIHRDCIINAKFVAALIVIGVLLFALGFLVMGCGLIAIGIPPTPGVLEDHPVHRYRDLLRGILAYGGDPVLALFPPGGYLCAGIHRRVAFFQCVLCDDRQRGRPGAEPSEMAPVYHQLSYQRFILGLMRLAPSELFNDATSTLLMPSVRSLGPLTMEQLDGAIPSPLPLGESIKVVWAQLTGLIAATVVCFAVSYSIFMRREIRSR